MRQPIWPQQEDGEMITAELFQHFQRLPSSRHSKQPRGGKVEYIFIVLVNFYFTICLCEKTAAIISCQSSPEMDTTVGFLGPAREERCT